MFLNLHTPLQEIGMPIMNVAKKWVHTVKSKNHSELIVDAVTGHDLITGMVMDLTFFFICMPFFFSRGVFETKTLEECSSVVSAGLLRILGKDLAEHPLVAASSDYQGQVRLFVRC
ncbi:hypothetical protein IFM89_025628 [Coptis chinensis]|uniref:Increased DNA methylation 1 C-terminal domain-containing protein n=1 Tax=Coptis chinensis TaxID=261450 RepID=A0A835LFQ7_9MAGN|nr:hypothetical protein IFM89_025628 [Coptis chinensis]